MYSPSVVKINQKSESAEEAFPDSERRKERRFNRKGVIMSIHCAYSKDMVDNEFFGVEKLEIICQFI